MPEQVLLSKRNAPSSVTVGGGWHDSFLWTCFFTVQSVLQTDSKFNSPFFPFLFFAESVKALLGRHTKILVKYVVKLETKGDKTENRVLVSNSSA